MPPKATARAATTVIAADDALAATRDQSLKKMGPDAPVPETTEWSTELLRRIEWKRIEELTAAYFGEKNLRTETIKAEADLGIDLKLFIKGTTKPFAVVQCKAWTPQKVGIGPLRELSGVMARERVTKGILVTAGEYTQQAIAFAKLNPIKLITGEMLLKGILALGNDAQARLLTVATDGDFTTPTCHACGIKMVRQDSDRGAFWGCRNFSCYRWI